MQVKVLFFGMLKDITGFASEETEIGESSSLATVWDVYAVRFPRLAPLKTHIRLARNREFSPLDTVVHPGDEIAFLPPVSGGSGRPVYLTRDPIDTRALVRATQRPSDGAVVTFEGVVRDNFHGRETTSLEYECYEGMALRMMEDLARDIEAKYSIGPIAIVHRLGLLAVGEASVVVVVSAPHRKPAFEACFEAINRLKATIPVWKKEHFRDGEVWVEGAWDV
jgi:molybdopterin synthase catalytic subunit